MHPDPAMTDKTSPVLTLDLIQTRLVGDLRCRCGTTSRFVGTHAENIQCPGCGEFFRVQSAGAVEPLGKEMPYGAVLYSRETHSERAKILERFETAMTAPPKPDR
jgi:hypothetical protein